MKKSLILLFFVVNLAFGQNSVTTTNSSVDIQSNATGTTPLLNIKLTQANPNSQITPEAVKIESNGQASSLRVKNTNIGSTGALYTISNGVAINAESNYLSSAGIFTNYHTSNNAPAIKGENRGLGRAGYFQIDNTSNISASIFAETNGIGAAGDFSITNNTSTVPAIRATTTGFGPAIAGVTYGDGRAGYFLINNSSNINTSLYAITYGLSNAGEFAISNSSNNSHAVKAETNGTGAAGYFNVLNSASGNAALYSGTNGSGPSIWSRNLGTGRAGHFQISNVSSSSSVIYAETNGTGAGGYFTSASGAALITGTGNVGIGNSTPHAPLQFSNSAVNRKIVLFETADNDHQYYGLGNNSSVFRYQVDATSANHIFYAATSASTSNELMRITGGGNVGINSPTPIHKIEAIGVGTVSGGTAGFKGSQWYSHFSYGTAEHTYIRGGKDAANVYINDVATLGNVGIGVGAPTEKLHVFGNLRVSGTICNTSGTIAACSDIRYKKNFSKIENPLDKVLTLNGLHYDWRVDEFKENNFSKDRQIGFIAQEIEKIFPEMVFTDEKGYKSVDYARLTPVLVEAIKELKMMNDELKTKNEKLESNNQKLESRLDKIEAILNK
jgi:hypothetical protein